MRRSRQRWWCGRSMRSSAPPRRKEKGMGGDELRWEAPGPGGWSGDVTYKLTGMTRPLQEIWPDGFSTGIASTFARYGLPLETLQVGYVNNYAYMQPKPVGAR